MKKIMMLLGVLVVLLVACQGYSAPSSGTSGTAALGIGDPSTDIQGVTAINIFIDKASLKQDAGNWIDLPVQREDDLLQLKNSGDFNLLGIVKVPEGNYTNLRLHISGMVVVDQSGSHAAKLPSDMLQIMTNFEVLNSTKSVALFDFNAADSLHKTGDGTYIFAPVLNLRTSSNVDLDKDQLANGKISIKAEQKVSQRNFGMSADGVVMPDFKEGDVSINASSGRVQRGRP